MHDSNCVETLDPLDSSMPRTYIRVAWIFEPTGSLQQTTQKLQYGLDKLAKQVGWISGKIHPVPPTPGSASSLEIRWNSNNTPALVDQGSIPTSYRWASSHGMLAEAIPSEVWPLPGMIDDTLFTAGAPVFGASIFRFADEGVGLCVCLHHNAVDATGVSEILRLWSRNITDPGFTLSSAPDSRSERFAQALSFDLQKTSSMTPDEILSRHPEYSSIPPTLPEGFPACRSKMFTISLHWVDILKELMRKYASTPLTTNTVICALTWAAITRVRIKSNPSLAAEKVRLATAVNGRHRISETFSSPESPFLGNAVFYSLSRRSAGTLAGTDETPVSTLAQVCDQIAHSQSDSVINSRHIAEVYRLVDLMEDCTKSLFVGWDLFRSRDLTITSWADLDLYGVDFGEDIGKPKYVRMPSMEADGVAIILPRQRAVEHEVLEVIVMLRNEHMDALEEDTMWQTLLSKSGRDEVDGEHSRSQAQ